jgi:soluble lytic murein transglycosylase-like protein
LTPSLALPLLLAASSILEPSRGVIEVIEYSSVQQVLKSVAMKEGVPYEVLEAICWVESLHKPWAVNKKEPWGGPSYGLCQLRLSTARDLGYLGKERGLLHPGQNALYAARYLKACMGAFQRESNNNVLSIACYNAGVRGVKRCLTRKGRPCNRKYVQRVLERIRTRGR